jgi:peptidoglycan/LPS O-acetylase OafA/YrhL
MINIFSYIKPKVKKTETSDLIRLYRDSLMGIAILWVIFFNLDLDFGKSRFLSHFLSFTKYTGYLGVDIFFFISGFSLITGWCRKKYTFIFCYKRRFLRIMHMYWIFLNISLILCVVAENLSIILINYTELGFLIRDSGHWFINAILVCYLIFPLFSTGFQRSKTKKRLSIAIIICLFLSILTTSSAFVFAKKFSFFLIFILRLPTFFIGCLIGYIYTNKNTYFNYLFLIYFHALFMLFCYISLALIYSYSSEVRPLYSLYWYPFAFGSFLLTFLLCIFLNIFSKRVGYILTISGKIGKSILELYFIHFLVFSQIVKIQSILSHINIFLEGNNLWLAVIFTLVLYAIAFNFVRSHPVLISIEKIYRSRT